MLRWILVCLTLVGGALTLPGAGAANSGDADAGRELAARWCSRCHETGPGGPMKQQPPAFAAIAVYRSPAYIRSNILVPHSSMPQLGQILSLNIDDLVAYIVSLEIPCPTR